MAYQQYVNSLATELNWIPATDKFAKNPTDGDTFLHTVNQSAYVAIGGNWIQMSGTTGQLDIEHQKGTLLILDKEFLDEKESIYK